MEADSHDDDQETKYRDLRFRVSAGIGDLDKGNYHDISDSEALDAFFEQIKARGRLKLDNSTGTKLT